MPTKDADELAAENKALRAELRRLQAKYEQPRDTARSGIQKKPEKRKVYVLGPPPSQFTQLRPDMGDDDRLREEHEDYWRARGAAEPLRRYAEKNQPDFEWRVAVELAEVPDGELLVLSYDLMVMAFGAATERLPIGLRQWRRTTRQERSDGMGDLAFVPSQEQYAAYEAAMDDYLAQIDGALGDLHERLEQGDERYADGLALVVDVLLARQRLASALFQRGEAWRGPLERGLAEEREEIDRAVAELDLAN